MNPSEARSSELTAIVHILYSHKKIARKGMDWMNRVFVKVGRLEVES